MGHSRKLDDWIVLDKLAGIILSAVEGCVVDIGVGLSTLVLAKHADRFGRKHYSCDIQGSRVQKIGKQLHANHTAHICTSIHFMTKFDDKCALVFLDGAHDYETIKTEADFFLDKMNEGGVLFIHDTYPPTEKLVGKLGGRCGMAYKVRQELEANDSFSTFTWPYLTQAQTCGLTMIMKKYLNRPYYQK